MARELAFAFGAALAYFFVRGLTETSSDVAIANAKHLIEFERWLGIFHEETVQRWVLKAPGASTIANWVYIYGHWPVIAVVAFWLIRWRPRTYFRVREAFLISGGIGLVIFALFPVAPPRLAGINVIDTVTEQSRSYRVLQPPAFTNQYAAMPSLHFGWDLLIGIALVRESRWLAVRAIGVLLPMAMAVAVVVTANHFIIDVIAGGALALLGLWIATLRPFRAVRRWLRRVRGADAGRAAASLGGGVLIVAHRAGNHPARLSEAIANGVTMVEADVWLHRGRLEVRHSKTLGPVPVRWDRWSLERGWVRPVLLEELVREVADRTTLMLDLKGGAPRLAEGVIEVMRRAAPGEEYIVSSQWWDSLQPFATVPEARVLRSVGSRRMLARLPKELPGVDGIAVHKRLLSAEQVAALRARAGIVATWPINTPQELAVVHGWGVDWAISDTLWRSPAPVTSLDGAGAAPIPANDKMPSTRPPAEGPKRS